MLRGRQASLDLLLLLREGGRWQNDAAVVARWRRKRIARREFGRAVGLGRKSTIKMTGADAQHEHDGRLAGLGGLETLLNGTHNRGQIGLWIQEPHLRFHRKGVGA